MSNLVERLRQHTNVINGGPSGRMVVPDIDCNIAANTIVALKAEVATLKAERDKLKSLAGDLFQASHSDATKVAKLEIERDRLKTALASSWVDVELIAAEIDFPPAPDGEPSPRSWANGFATARDEIVAALRRARSALASESALP